MPVARQMTHAEISAKAESIRSHLAGQKRQTSGGDWDASTAAFMDQFKQIRTPSAADLLREFTGIAYACAQINAKAVASVPFKLYVQTRQGDKAPRVRTRSTSAANLRRLMGRQDLRTRLRKAVVVEEVEDHPALDLLQNWARWLFTVESLDVAGTAFWRPEPYESGSQAIIEQLIELPSHQVVVKKGETIREPIAGFKYGQQPYAADELIYFRFPSLTDPFCGGYSPMQAAWQQVLLGDKTSSHLHNALDRQPSISFLITPEDAPQMGSMEEWDDAGLRRFSAKINKKAFVRRESLVLSNRRLKVHELASSARELELAAERGLNRDEIAICFDVPPAMLSTQTNLDNLKASVRQHAKQGVEPRVVLLDDAINDQLMPLFDPTGRLVFAHDDCVPADEAADTAKETAELASGKISINEARKRANLDPVSWGYEPWFGTAKRQPSEERQLPYSVQAPKPEAPTATESEPEPDKATDTTTGEKARQGAEEAAGGGDSGSPAPAVLCPSAKGEQTARETPPTGVALPTGTELRSTLRKLFKRQRDHIVDLWGLAPGAKAVKAADLDELPPIDWEAQTEEFRRAAAPVVQIYAEEGAHEANLRLGATDEDAAWRVQLPQVEESAQQLALKFSASTNAATSRALDSALSALRTSIAEGLLSAENTIPELTKRVQGIFDGAEKERARTIARTESSRALHRGQIIAAKQSGMVAGKEWLAGGDACPVCLALNGRKVGLDDAFDDDGLGGDYSVTTEPPLHPNCNCTLIDVLKPLDEVLYGEGWGESGDEE